MRSTPRPWPCPPRTTQATVGAGSRWYNPRQRHEHDSTVRSAAPTLDGRSPRRAGHRVPARNSSAASRAAALSRSAHAFASSGRAVGAASARGHPVGDGAVSAPRGRPRRTAEAGELRPRPNRPPAAGEVVDAHRLRPADRGMRSGRERLGQRARGRSSLPARFGLRAHRGQRPLLPGRAESDRCEQARL